MEFGGGEFSTPLILEAKSVTRLVTVEKDRTWRLWLERLSDPRLEVQTERADPSQFDLVFIDDGVSALEREQTIKYVLGFDHPPTVIHDAEHYMNAIAEYSEHFEVFAHTLPATAVCW